jgi:macrodomain Ter protein organizer (MatP/YcbG family)
MFGLNFTLSCTVQSSKRKTILKQYVTWLRFFCCCLARIQNTLVSALCQLLKQQYNKKRHRQSCLHQGNKIKLKVSDFVVEYLREYEAISKTALAHGTVDID